MENKSQTSTEEITINNIPKSNLQTISPLNGRRSLKKIMIAGFIFFLVILTLFFVNSLSSKKPALNVTNKPTIEPYVIFDSHNEINRFTVKEMAREIINYIKSQKRSDGYYNYIAHFDEQCPKSASSDKCGFGGVNMFETTNAWGALALFSASKILREPSFLEEAIQDLKKMQIYCEKDRNQCNRVLIQPYLIYKATNNPELLNFLTAQSNTLLNAPVAESPMLMAIEARSNLYMYQLDKNPLHLKSIESKLQASSDLLQKSTKNIYNDSPTQFKSGSCWLTLGSIEYYKLANKNLLNVSVFLANGKLNENFSQIMVPSEIQPCIESYVMLYKATGDQNYLKTAKNLMSLFIKTFFDGNKLNKVYGEGGTKFTNGIHDKTMDKIVTLTDSAYTLYLLNLFYEN